MRQTFQLLQAGSPSVLAQQLEEKPDLQGCIKGQQDQDNPNLWDILHCDTSWDSPSKWFYTRGPEYSHLVISHGMGKNRRYLVPQITQPCTMKCFICVTSTLNCHQKLSSGQAAHKVVVCLLSSCTAHSQLLPVIFRSSPVQCTLQQSNHGVTKV